MDDKKNQLENIRKRLQKAYLLPPSEQKKWKKQIAELEKQAAELEQELEGFNENEAEAMLFAVIRRLADKWTGGNGDLEKFLSKHPAYKEKEDVATKAVDTAFKLKNKVAVKQAVKQYEDTLNEIIMLANSENIKIAEQNGFTLLDDDSEEAKQIDMLFRGEAVSK